MYITAVMIDKWLSTTIVMQISQQYYLSCLSTDTKHLIFKGGITHITSYLGKSINQHK